MKKIITSVYAMLLSVVLFAQLPDGSTAPDWTMADINGQSHIVQLFKPRQNSCFGFFCYLVWTMLELP
ncbi:MAG: hypothetical protein IPL95_13320 [Saprospiraceae bacterium]|nr:hypothetical protein [Saprospiraceae bacterium]